MSYYLAYGSNLNLKQMKHRCPDAQMVGRAMLEGYALQFRLYLTIQKKEGSKVPIGVYELNKRDEKSLDNFEGYPYSYKKEQVVFELDGEPCIGFVYVINEKLRPLRKPTQQYLDTVLSGYKDFGFDPSFIEAAL